MRGSPRACEFATVDRCRCFCEGRLHGRRYMPTDPRVPAGDEHWVGYQIPLFPGLDGDEPAAPEPVTLQPGDTVGLRLDSIRPEHWRFFGPLAVVRGVRNSEGVVELHLTQQQGPGSPAPGLRAQAMIEVREP